MQHKSREEIISEWVAEQAAAQRQERKKHRQIEEVGGVTINSLMDAMTIILIFLLMNYSIDPLRVDPSDDLKLPASTTDISPEPSATVTVTANGIVVNDEMIVAVANGEVDKSKKMGNEGNPQIQPLFEALNEEATRQKEMARLTGSRFDGLLTVIADHRTPYQLLSEVLYTAGQAEFQKFKFAVVKNGSRGI